jgi:hypothetical protein
MMGLLSLCLVILIAALQVMAMDRTPRPDWSVLGKLQARSKRQSSQNHGTPEDQVRNFNRHGSSDQSNTYQPPPTDFSALGQLQPRTSIQQYGHSAGQSSQSQNWAQSEYQDFPAVYHQDYPQQQFSQEILHQQNMNNLTDSYQQQSLQFLNPASPSSSSRRRRRRPAPSSMANNAPELQQHNEEQNVGEGGTSFDPSQYQATMESYHRLLNPSMVPQYAQTEDDFIIPQDDDIEPMNEEQDDEVVQNEVEDEDDGANAKDATAYWKRIKPTERRLILHTMELRVREKSKKILYHDVWRYMTAGVSIELRSFDEKRIQSAISKIYRCLRKSQPPTMVIQEYDDTNVVWGYLVDTQKTKILSFLVEQTGGGRRSLNDLTSVYVTEKKAFQFLSGTFLEMQSAASEIWAHKPKQVEMFSFDKGIRPIDDVPLVYLGTEPVTPNTLIWSYLNKKQHFKIVRLLTMHRIRFGEKMTRDAARKRLTLEMLARLQSGQKNLIEWVVYEMQATEEDRSVDPWMLGASMEEVPRIAKNVSLAYRIDIEEAYRRMAYYNITAEQGAALQFASTAEEMCQILSGN